MWRRGGGTLIKIDLFHICGRGRGSQRIRCFTSGGIQGGFFPICWRGILKSSPIPQNFSGGSKTGRPTKWGGGPSFLRRGVPQYPSHKIQKTKGKHDQSLKTQKSNTSLLHKRKSRLLWSGSPPTGGKTVT